MINHSDHQDATNIHTISRLAVKKQPCTLNNPLNGSIIEELADTFTTQPAKVSLLLELIGVAYTNKDQYKYEKGFIQDIAEKLSIPRQLLNDIECWVELQFVLIKEAKMLMGEKLTH